MNFQLAGYVMPVFLLCVAYTLWWLGKALSPILSTRKSQIAVASIGGIWLLLQALLAQRGFYYAPTSMPPHMTLAIMPPVIFMVVLFAVPATRKQLMHIDLRALTWLNAVRIPVELTLFWLFIGGYVPQLMTFEGANFDILTGITAIAAAIWGFTANGSVARRWLLLLWNMGGLILLFNIVIRAVLAIPSPIQQLAFEQPNVAVLYFPFIWLPSVIVVAALFTHVLSLWRLLAK